MRFLTPEFILLVEFNNPLPSVATPLEFLYSKLATSNLISWSNPWITKFSSLNEFDLVLKLADLSLVKYLLDVGSHELDS